MSSNRFTVLSVKLHKDLVVVLYREASKIPGSRVEILTDRIVNEYIDIHKDDRMLTTYVYGGGEYKYNFQMRQKTAERVREMAKKYHTSISTILKTVIKIWVLQN